MIAWALRFALVSVACVALLGLGVRDYGAALVGSMRPAPAAVSAPPERPAALSNSLVYRADARGHVIIEAWVNGARVRFLLDTGASRVALTPEAARAAGFGPGDLVFDHEASTAAGVVRVAPVTLREVRIDQLSLYDVPATVIEKLPISLLGMSFLGRLRSWQMRDGTLTITW